MAARRAWEELLARTSRYTIAYRRGTLARAVRDSRYCREVTTDEGRWLLWRTTPLKLAQVAVAAHRQAVNDEARILERNEVHTATRVPCGSRRLIVHEIWPGAHPGAIERWVSAFQAYCPSLFVAPHLALLTTADGAALLIRGDLEGPLLHGALANDQSTRRPHLLAAVGAMAARMHAAEVSGLPPANEIVVVHRPRNPFAELGLTDPTCLRFDITITDAVRAADLRVFCRSLPASIPPRGRAILLAGYRRCAGLSRLEMNKIIELM